MTWTLNGRGVLLWLLAFFGLIFATNIFFITVAVRTFRGEDVQSPYLQGAEYNDTIARRAEQEKLGWKAKIAATRLLSGQVRVDVALAKFDGAPETGQTLGGELRHPADSNRDHLLKLKEEGPGHYRAELPGVSRGSWEVMISSSARDKPFEAVRKVWVP